jgi:D-alanine transaminase
VFADAVYEALRVYRGKPFALALHQARLARSLSELGIHADVDQIGRDVAALIDRSGLDGAVVYYQISRGVQPRDHVPAEGLTATVIITVREYKRSLLLSYEEGVTVITAPDIRWGRVDIKTTNLLPNVLARWQARERRAYEAILLRDEIVREACMTSVVIAKGGAIVAPRQGPWILPSITRAVVEALCKENGVAVEERDFTKAELMAADEVLLLGSTTEVVAATRVDDQSIGSGGVGPMARRLLELYRAHVAESLGLSPSDIG